MDVMIYPESYRKKCKHLVRYNKPDVQSKWVKAVISKNVHKIEKLLLKHGQVLLEENSFEVCDENKQKYWVNATEHASYHGLNDVLRTILFRTYPKKNKVLSKRLTEYCFPLNVEAKSENSFANSGHFNRRSAIHWAILNGHKDCVLQLLYLGNINVDSTDEFHQTALHLACKRNNIDLVRILVLHGAQINAEDNKKLTPLHYTCQNTAKSGIISENLHMQFPGVGQSVATMQERAALNFRTKDKLAILKLLLENGGDTHAYDQNGDTPLHYASRNDDTEVIKSLLNRNSFVNLANKIGCTALHVACESEQITVAELLIENGANGMLKNMQDQTAIELAMLKGNHKLLVSIISKLISRGNITLDMPHGPCLQHELLSKGAGSKNIMSIEELLDLSNEKYNEEYKKKLIQNVKIMLKEKIGSEFCNTQLLTNRKAQEARNPTSECTKRMLWFLNEKIKQYEQLQLKTESRVDEISRKADNCCARNHNHTGFLEFQSKSLPNHQAPSFSLTREIKNEIDRYLEIRVQFLQEDILKSLITDMESRLGSEYEYIMGESKRYIIAKLRNLCARLSDGILRQSGLKFSDALDESEPVNHENASQEDTVEVNYQDTVEVWDSVSQVGSGNICCDVEHTSGERNHNCVEHMDRSLRDVWTNKLEIA